MSALEELLKKNNRFQLVATVVLAIYIISGVNTDAQIASKVNTSIGHIVIILAVLGLFSRTNLILGIAIIISGYELIRRSHPKNVNTKPSHFRSPLLENFTHANSRIPVDQDSAPVKPSVDQVKTKKMIDMQADHKDLLEVEIISNTPKFVKVDDLSHASYKSVQCDTHDAANIH